jgi:VanZ family protein
MQKKKWWIVLTVFWIIFIYFLTESPYSTGESTSSAIEKTIVKTEEMQPDVFQPADPSTIHHINVFIRKSAHIIVFGILAIFLFKCLEGRRLSYLLALGLTFLFAIFDEWHQSFVDDRTSAFKDVLFDTFGASIALLFVYIILRDKKSSPKK